MTALSIETRLKALTTSIANGTHAAGTINGAAVDCQDTREAKFQLYIHTDNGALQWKFQHSADGSTGWTDCLDFDGNLVGTAADAVTATGTYLAKLLTERYERYLRPVLVVTGTNMQGSCHAEVYSPTNVAAPTVAIADGSFAIVA